MGVERLGFNKLWGTVLLAAWLVVLIVTVVLAGGSEYASHKELHWFAAFYRTGSDIFGGGQVGAPGCCAAHFLLCACMPSLFVFGKQGRPGRLASGAALLV